MASFAHMLQTTGDEGKQAPPTAHSTKRLTLDLTREEHRALKLLSVEHEVPMADLLRGAIAELREDPVLLGRVTRHAS
jgi:hypothetical protein